MRNDDLREIIEANFQAMRARIQANADITDLIHEEIKKQNGRIHELEKETAFMRIIHRNPTRAMLVMILVVFGIIFAINNGWFEFLKL